MATWRAHGIGVNKPGSAALGVRAWRGRKDGAMQISNNQSNRGKIKEEMAGIPSVQSGRDAPQEHLSRLEQEGHIWSCDIITESVSAGLSKKGTYAAALSYDFKAAWEGTMIS
eukprot:scaffold55500_cov20-Tisochrysis_lutea.AAC.3